MNQTKKPYAAGRPLFKALLLFSCLFLLMFLGVLANPAAAHEVRFSQASFIVDQNQDSATVTVVLDPFSPFLTVLDNIGDEQSWALEVDFATSDGTAVAGVDYVPVSQTVRFSGNGLNNFTVMEQAIVIPLLGNSDAQTARTVNLNLSNLRVSVGGSDRPDHGVRLQGAATLSIGGDVVPQLPGQIQFQQAQFSILENSGSATISVIRTGGTAGAVSVDFASVDGSAQDGIDYQAVAGTLSWADGQGGVMTFTVPIIDNSATDGNRVLNLNLRNPTGGATLGSPSTAGLGIRDDEGPTPPNPGQIGFEQDEFRGAEGDGPVIIRVVRSGGSDGRVSVNFVTSDGTATAGDDYQSVSTMLVWEDGETGPREVSVSLLADSEREGDETVNLTLSDPVSVAGEVLLAPSQATLFISDVTVGLAGLAGLSPGELSLAMTFDAQCSGASGAFRQRCEELFQLGDTDVRTALRAISPGQIAAQGTLALQTTYIQITNLTQRITQRRTGSEGGGLIAFKGLAFSVDGQSLPVGGLADAWFRQKFGGSAGEESPGEFSLFDEGRLGAFVNGLIIVGDQDNTTNEAGFDFDTAGLTLGVDYRLGDNIVLGGAFGYASTDADFDGDGGDTELDGYSLSFYGSYYTPDSFYVDWIASYAWNDFETTRNIGYSGFSTRATGDTDSGSLSLSLGTGVDFSKAGWLFSPYARIDYADVDIDSYSESGGDGLALAVEDQSIESLNTILGGRASRAVSLSWGVMTPTVHAEWVHEFKDNDREIIARFADDPRTPFVTPTDNPDRNFFRVGAGAVAVFAGGKSAFLSYEARVGDEDFSSQRVELGFRMEF